MQTGQTVSTTQIPGAARHAFVYRFVRTLLAWPVEKFLKAHITRVPHLPWPALILPNHTADVDIPLIGIACPQPMYYMAAEQLFQNPTIGRIIQYLVAPIVKRKGASDAKAAREALQRIRAGHHVCLFPEGNTTFDGLTGPMSPAIGRLLLASGAGLVTYRIEGGYLSWPRWGHSLRRGKLTGKPMHVLSPDEVKSMTYEQLNALIIEDLQVDAYAANREEQVRYRGKRLAEGIGNALYLCPACEKMGTITSSGSEFSCACGLRGTYEETGTLTGVPFDTVRAWTDWQKGVLLARAQAHPHVPVCEDAGQTLYLLDAHGNKTHVAEGTLHMSAHALTLGSFTIAVHDLAGLDLFRSNTLMFSTRRGEHYQVGSAHERSGLPYRDLYRALTDRKE